MALHPCPRCAELKNVQEPILHSHITDGLEDDHPKAYQTLYCVECHDTIHAGNKECMKTWVETGKGDYCLDCFVGRIRDSGVGLGYLDSEWGLPRPVN